MSRKKMRVLDVGQCGADHGTIRHLITRHFDADVEGVMFVDDAIDALARGGYDLVLVNRLIFADGSDGGELITRMKSDPSTASTPVMLISNYDDAQEAAVLAGAVRGFGKANIDAPDTLDRLVEFLPRKSNEARST